MSACAHDLIERNVVAVPDGYMVEAEDGGSVAEIP